MKTPILRETRGCSSGTDRASVNWLVLVLCGALAGCLAEGETELLEDDEPGSVEQASFPAGLILKLAAGRAHTCALTRYGGVECWGGNEHGQLGRGSTVDSLAHVGVTGLSSNVLQVVAGSDFSCARLSGGVACWGRNDAGQLGDGTTTTRKAPVPVLGLSGVASIAAGDRHACALLLNQTVKCWGANERGQLGDGTTSMAKKPVGVAGLSSATQVAPGPEHTCALTGDGTARCWGGNSAGQVSGVATTTPRLTPVAGPALPAAALAIGVMESSSCATLATKNVVCWGGGVTGLSTIGLSSHTARSLLAGGSRHLCVATDQKAIFCWGDNAWGQLGDGTTLGRSGALPKWIFLDGGYYWSGAARVVDWSDAASDLTAGDGHTCAVSSSRAMCWGDNRRGQLGDGTRARVSPTIVPGLPSLVSGIGLGSRHSCALSSAGALSCWGNNDHAQLGTSSWSNTKDGPAPVAGVSDVAAVDGDRVSTCALLGSGGVTCWGSSTRGGDLVPSGMQQVGVTAVSQLAAGSDRMCALTSSGQVQCWTWASAPALVPVSPAVSIAAGDEHACAALRDGGAACWGTNASGQLGDGTTQLRPQPVTVKGIGGPVTELAAGGSHSCASVRTTVYQNGLPMLAYRVLCWGANDAGQLGNGSTTNSASPAIVSGLSSTNALAAGDRHTCALTGAGVKCWGANGDGQLGDGSFVNRNTPVSVSGLPAGSTFVALAAKGNHTCALSSGGQVICWGSNAYGEVDGRFPGYPRHLIGSPWL